MNWNALGALAELLGAAGVIITLIYLSRQIRSNNVQLRGAATVAVHEAQRSMPEQLASDPELLNLLRKANSEWDSLTTEEQSRVSVWNVKESGFWELCYQLERQGALETSVYRAREKYFLALFNTPGKRAWWDTASVFLEDDFYEEMTRKMDLMSKDEFAKKYPFFYNLDSDSPQDTHEA